MGFFSCCLRTFCFDAKKRLLSCPVPFYLIDVQEQLKIKNIYIYLEAKKERGVLFIGLKNNGGWNQTNRVEVEK